MRVEEMLAVGEELGPAGAERACSCWSTPRLGLATPPAAGTRQIGSVPRPSKRITPSELQRAIGAVGDVADRLRRPAGDVHFLQLAARQ